MPRTPATELDRLERLANRMDAAFRVPGLGLRIGWDSVIGLVPGIGDGLAAAPALYILMQGSRLGARPWALGRMAVNTGLDLGVGAIPIFGDLFDAAFKSNRRNIRLLRADLAAQGVTGPSGGLAA